MAGGGVAGAGDDCCLSAGWHAGFIWDDDVYVTNNLLLTAPDGLRRIWFSLDSPSQYFPLTYTVFRIQHTLWGFMPRVIIGQYPPPRRQRVAGVAAVATFGRARCMAGGGDFRPAPVQGGVGAWVTERKSVLTLFFNC